MEPPGGGAAEVRLYRRPSYGATLVELAALEPVAPPRPVEVGSDRPVEEVDGDLGRSAGLYLALVQDGQVVDVARLLNYAGEAAEEDDEAEDYWETGSNTSEDDWSTPPPRDDRVSEFRYSSSSSSEAEHAKSSDAEQDKQGCALGSASRDGASSATGALRTGHDQGEWSSSSEEDGITKGFSRPIHDISHKGSEKKDGDGDEEEEDRTDGASSVWGALRMWHDQDIWSSSSEEDANTGGHDQDIWSSSSEEDDDTGGFWCPIHGSSDKGSDNKDRDEEEDEEDKTDGALSVGHDQDIWSSSSGDRQEEEEKEVSEVDDDHENEQQGQPLQLKLRLWPAKKHLRIKIFSCSKWIATKVYRLSWTEHEELEELFESSFKMDIGAPVAANTVFSIQDCSMDFEGLMLYTPIFGELVDEFKPSVREFKFCRKLGGEENCRVFKCLFRGGKFALKSVRLEVEESCTMEPREVEIISSLKDKRVMAFYQAWIEPWLYKKKPVAYYLFIQVELCQSTLKDQLLPENFKSIPDRWYLFEEMVKCVKTIHDEFIVHRDLKPDNIFFGSDMRICIGDFGDSCIGRDELGGYGGTPNLGTKDYAAPELETAKKITEKVDIYPIGVMFVEIFMIFKTVFEKRTILSELKGKGLPSGWVSDNESARWLVERMIAVEPAYRPSATEILEYIGGR